jgi:hypothetical protein
VGNTGRGDTAGGWGMMSNRAGSLGPDRCVQGERGRGLEAGSLRAGLAGLLAAGAMVGAVGALWLLAGDGAGVG